ncbi:MAG: amino acid ABC transporter substrate-binding protein [Comamonadaceae bacterium]|jgi:branched-chain amino acid transport system substrate-binding protein|uniref:amino acid ABC transporter substrate-binding protein n=1 Tax=Candidatus Skiveiella danica TaxID=3386177 RepID=UPI001E039258|nr:amino acid ABC transporter substrate-binding protein [Comamonadaceae bacterium]MBK9198740.1 amino acid ABC transporter substrate-binding protein [Betaproteobacteria bacterium]MBK6559043.1 amino acid ABC transporter substrate-binding protein [Comamonadaceae bacterium]MBK6927858.1 amino acid ABC transporter substrate-binding protein [Comamonadaceae bacterium]MBK7118046.1 amino acid ABC transporter substrate-binding protein [Comamonadaceae bacterium]
MVHPTRRQLIKGAAATVGAMSIAPGLMAQAAPVRVGYAIARTGPWTGGAQVSQEPNYLLWAEQQNAAGGLSVKGVKRPIELISSDDRSDVETCVRSYEKLMGSDKVDLVLPPWGSNANFAVAPLANRFQYPLLAPTALSRRLVEMKLPYFFLLLQQPKAMCDALVDMLKANKVKSVALIYVDDLFGLENFAAFKVALQGSGISLVEDKSYPGGVKDLSPVLRSMKDKNPDAFVGFTYPPDTILASKQAKEVGFNPKFFYASVGTAFQLYKNVMTPAGAEGVLGMGSWNSKTSPGAKAYFDAHTKKFGGKEPDRWASGACWAGLEILTAAVAKHGLDRKAIRDFVADTTHKTIIGDIRFTGSENTATLGTVSQWQNGEFEVVWPEKLATAKLNPTKPAWK